jgi:wyosine [tRNA(Phe)-imidazoG37] synthetase (radical SAM superfamily)
MGRMSAAEHHIAFGPVPSRRLGRSLGINNVTAKVCSYGCVYCQVGITTEQCVQPRAFFSPAQVLAAVRARLDRLGPDRVDYLTFVPDGEPTLDSRLSESIAALRGLGLPVAVISNASLLWRAEVRAALAAADLVSIKLDTVDETLWRRINRPHPALALATVLQGVRDFAAGYPGTLISDTMLLAGVNDGVQALTASADFLAGLPLRTAYLAVPTRPTTERGIQGSDAAGLLQAHQIFAARLPRVELLSGHEVGEFAHTGDARQDLLAVTAVHPMREDDVRRLLAADGADWSLLEQLLADGELLAADYQGHTFYLRPVR